MKKYLIPLLLFGIATTLALYNISNFPKMVGDEGIYVSQAYWLAHFGRLGPYTYWYDHSPLGWAQIGLWQLITGATQFLGYTVLSARVFMGIILGGTTTILYLLTFQLTKSKLSSLLTSCLYITSALTLTFGRMVLLDNLAIFWFLLSILLLHTHPTRLKNLIFSALSISIAILSKESLLFFLPPYLLSVYIQNRNNINKKYALLVSFITIFFVLSFFPLLAILKGELFPKLNQVSFLGTMLFQSERGSGIPFWQEGSHFREMTKVWINIDPILILIGTVSTIIIPILPSLQSVRIIPIFSIFFLLFLIRGGQIYDFYIIPLLPLLALNISLLVEHFTTITKKNFLKLIFIVSALIYFFLNSLYPFTSRATYSQKQAIDALKALPSQSTIVSTNYAYLDLYLQNKNKIHWYQKIESDKNIQESTGNITNLLVDEQFAREISDNQLPFLKSQLEKESMLAKFGKQLSPGENIRPYTSEYLSLYQVVNSGQSIQYVIKLESTDPITLKELNKTSPYGIIITRDNFTNSTDLEKYITTLKTIFNEEVKVITSQDDTGINTIPWITTPGRSFYKSNEEASLATIKKTEALKKIGFTSSIITSSDNSDSYLPSIILSASLNIVPILRFNNSIPTVKTPILVTNKNDADLLKKSNYSGEILYLTSEEEYLKINN